MIYNPLDEFVQILSGSNTKMIQECIVCIGNIAVDHTENADLILQHYCFDYILRFLKY